MGVVTIEKAKKRINWGKIRAEYIAGGVSLRALAQKHGISKDMIARKAREQSWEKDCATVCDTVATTMIQKTADAIVDNVQLAADIKRKGLLLVNRLFDEYTASATEHRDYQGRNVSDIKRLRDLTGAYKDLTGDILPGATANNELLQSLLDMERRSEP